MSAINIVDLINRLTVDRLIVHLRMLMWILCLQVVI